MSLLKSSIACPALLVAHQRCMEALDVDWRVEGFAVEGRSEGGAYLSDPASNDVSPSLTSSSQQGQPLPCDADLALMKCVNSDEAELTVVGRALYHHGCAESKAQFDACWHQHRRRPEIERFYPCQASYQQLFECGMGRLMDEWIEKKAMAAAESWYRRREVGDGGGER